MNQYAPRTATLAETIYEGLENDDYLLEIYNSLLHNYAVRILKAEEKDDPVNKQDALRYADLLSKSTHPEKSDQHKVWGQEIAILMNYIYKDDPEVKYCLGSVLSAAGNYRGLQSESMQGFEIADVMDGLYYSYDKAMMAIPGEENSYFFHDQKKVYDEMDGKLFSYSGPTSMGKSFVAQTYIIQKVENGAKGNFAILVPTKALINEVRKNLIEALKDKLRETNYRIVTSSGDIALKQDHSYIFVMTPERMNYLLTERADIHLAFLFIDEAHKTSEKSGRSAYYWKILTQLKGRNQFPTVIFASPNTPNPELYFDMIPEEYKESVKPIASKYSPVCQFKFFVDLAERENKRISYYDEHSHDYYVIKRLHRIDNLSSIIRKIGGEAQNLVYCSSRQQVIDSAVDYSYHVQPSSNPKLIKLADEIRKEVHEDCFLADLIEKGIAYHVGYLPANIRLKIEKNFENGNLRIIFCTSTLIEGVNLPADNLFITSYKNGRKDMNEVQFRNLVGRVGRIKYNLYGNVFFVRENEKHDVKKYYDLLENEIPDQTLSVNNPDIKRNLKKMVSDLAVGDTTLATVKAKATREEYDTVRKMSLILTRDIATDDFSPLRKETEQYISNEQLLNIKEHYPIQKTSDDITLSNDQAENLSRMIKSPKWQDGYPKLGENDSVDFEEVVKFLAKLRDTFLWNEYEREMMEKEGIDNRDSLLRWYATILLRWIRGYGLRQIIESSLIYKANHPDSGVYSGKQPIASFYDKNNRQHRNYVIAETMWVIENIVLFNISSYFRKFSLEYKAYHHVDRFDNDWYEYVEYGTTNKVTIFLQQLGFSRESSTYIMRTANRRKYLIEDDPDNIRIRKSILECDDATTVMDAEDIQFNAPEYFVDI